MSAIKVEMAVPAGATAFPSVVENSANNRARAITTNGRNNKTRKNRLPAV